MLSKVEELERLVLEERIVRASMERVQAEIEELGQKRAAIIQEMTLYANQFDVAHLLGIHQTRVSRVIRKLRHA